MSRWYSGGQGNSSSVKFDPADFNVPPSLTKGTSQRIQLYIQSAHARGLDILARCGHFPWGKDTDVVRWCIQHGLTYVNNIDPGVITSVLQQANAMNDLLQHEINQQKFIETINRTNELVLGYRGTGELDMAKDLVNQLWQRILAMPDEPDREARWKQKYMDRFEGLFKDLIEYGE